jgi:hypothetical protein
LATAREAFGSILEIGRLPALERALKGRLRLRPEENRKGSSPERGLLHLPTER